MVVFFLHSSTYFSHQLTNPSRSLKKN
jgi:hypothetical protein